MPTGCKVKIDDRKTFAMGHIRRSADIQLDLRKDFYNLNLTEFLPKLKVENVINVSALWEDMATEEMEITEGITEVKSILDKITFTPRDISITLFSLITNAIITAMVLMIVLFRYVPQVV